MSETKARTFAAHFILGLMLLVGSSANAAVCVPDANGPICFAEDSWVQISWAPATGPVAYYEVFTSRNGRRYRSELTTSGPEPLVLLGGEPNEIIRVRVRACDGGSSCGPRSQVSDRIQMQVRPASLGTESDQDFNGDGYPDLLWRNTVTGELALWAVNRGASTDLGMIDHGYSLEWQPVARIDFNQDGFTDLLWRNEITGENQALLLEETTVVGTLDIAALPSAWVLDSVGDFNGDESTDFFWRNIVSGEAVIWHMDQNLVMGTLRLPLFPVDNWYLDSISGDLNGDGVSDIVVRGRRKNVAIGFLMQPTSFTGILLKSQNNRKRELVGAQDLNGDSVPELIWSDTSGKFEAWPFRYLDDPKYVENSWRGRLRVNLEPYLKKWKAMRKGKKLKSKLKVKSKYISVQTMGDYDGDGLLEFVLCDSSTGTHYIYQLSPHGVVESIAQISTVSNPDWQVLAFQ